MEILDSRDLIKRWDDLLEEQEQLVQEIKDHPSKKDGLEQDLQEVEDEIGEIEALADTGIEDWHHGAAFIPVDDFQEYAEDFAESIGAIQEAREWPCNCIDWERAAEQLASDYTEVEYRGTHYYVR